MEYQQEEYQQEEYDESQYQQRTYDDIDVDADRVVAMNPSGVVERYENESESESESGKEGKKLNCTGDVCTLEDYSNHTPTAESISKPSYVKYFLYFLLFVALCILGYFGYKKFISKS